MNRNDPEPAGSAARVPILAPGHTYASVTDKISALVLVRPYNWRWFLGMAIGFFLTTVLFTSLTVLLLRGVGIWGIDVPVMWGFAIVNFVWWIGIGHAGTLISAILLLLKQDWRTSINRFAEAMTLVCRRLRGAFPAVSHGAALAFLLADAVSEYDGALAAVAQPAGLGRVRRFDVRDGFALVLVRRPDPRSGDAAGTGRKNRWAQYIYGFLAMGWRGSARHWHRYRTAYLLLAGLATPLVVSVHTIVAFDFTIAILPGWHSTIFPAVLRGGGDLLGLCDGDHAGDSLAGGIRPRGFHHDPAPRQHGQGHARDRHDRGLWLHDGIVLGVVRRTIRSRNSCCSRTGRRALTHTRTG